MLKKLFQIQWMRKKWKWYFITKIVLTYCEKKLLCNRKKLLKFQAEGQELEITRKFI